MSISPPGIGARTSRFDTTRWSLINAVADQPSAAARDALASLCQSYWYPLYAYVRRQGHDADAAQDLTQEFFARLIERRDLDRVAPERGRFRSFLLAAMQHFLFNDAEKKRALKRGGGAATLPLEWERAEDRYRREPVDADTPETVFDRRWALTTLDRALGRVRREALAADGGAQFEALKACLTDSIPHGSYQSLGASLGISEGAVKAAVHRLRRRFQRALRREIADTVLSGEDVDDELRYLFRVIAR